MFKKKILSTLFPAISVAIVVFASLFMVGAEASNENGSASIKLYSYLIGRGKLVCNIGLIKHSLTIHKISYFGLFALEFLVVGIILLIVSYFKKIKVLTIIGNVLLIASGICILMLLELGYTLKQTETPTQVYYFLKELGKLKIGLGVYLWAIICITAGGCGLLTHFSGGNK